jgi:quercetin dioxygenase-like cupin family protein
VLFSAPECRGVVIDLQAGDAMGEHSVHERAVVQVVEGSILLGPPGGEVECSPGTLATFDPGERHTLSALAPSRILLLLTPWPGDGHYQASEDAHPERLPAHAQAPPLAP